MPQGRLTRPPQPGYKAAMRVSVRLFSSLSPYRPKDPDNVEVAPGETAAGLASRLGIPAGELGLAFVNGSFVEPEAKLADGDAVLLLPPISGG